MTLSHIKAEDNKKVEILNSSLYTCKLQYFIIRAQFRTELGFELRIILLFKVKSEDSQFFLFSFKNKSPTPLSPSLV